MPAKTYELNISLLYAQPEITRVLAVPSNLLLGDLHVVLQAAMGWTNSHMHEFAIAVSPSEERRFVQRLNAWGEPTDLEGDDEDAFTLAEVCPEVGSKMLYTYDYGDNWEHLVEVTKIEKGASKAKSLRCLEGKNACPPEDCGGVGGYEELLEAIGDPDHEMHEDMVEWIGDDFDAQAFDLKAVNKQLKALLRA